MCRISYLKTSSSSQAFPIIWGRRNGFEFLSSTLACPLRSPPFPILSTSISNWFTVFLSIIIPGTGASTFLHMKCSYSLLLTCPYHFSFFSAIFLLIVSRSFLILSFFVIPHIHRSILISFTSNLFSLLPVPRPHTPMLATYI